MEDHRVLEIFTGAVRIIALALPGGDSDRDPTQRLIFRVRLPKARAPVTCVCDEEAVRALNDAGGINDPFKAVIGRVTEGRDDPCQKGIRYITR